MAQLLWQLLRQAASCPLYYRRYRTGTANIGAANLERIKRSFAPWTMRIEQAWSRRLLPEGYCFEAEAESLLKLDPQTQAQLELAKTQNDAAGIAAGIFTIDEVRATRGLAPIGNSTPQLTTPQDLEND